MYLKNNKGLTLIEVLAALVLITILMTSYIKFFADGVLFSNKNEEILTASNDARAVITLIQENDRKNYILQDYVTTLADPEYPEDSIVISDESTRAKLLFPWKDSEELTYDDQLIIEHTELVLVKGPDNLIQIEVNIKSPTDPTKIISSTNGFLTNKYLYDLKDINISPENGIFHLRSTDVSHLTDLLSQPLNTGIAVQMTNFANPEGSDSRIKTEGDLAFMKINDDVDEFTISSTVEFTSPNHAGGFGILVDGVIPNPTMNRTEALENGYMLVFKPTLDNKLGTIDLFLREAGLNYKGTTLPVDTISLTTDQFEKGSSISLNSKFNVKVIIENLDETRRTYKVVLQQGDTDKTKSLVFGTERNHYIDLKNITGYRENSKFIGVRLWSNSSIDEDQNTLSIYR